MKNKNKGFTLIELLVVMAIIGILAGVILVSISSFKKRAMQSAALQTARSVMPFVESCAVAGNNLSHSANGVDICSGAGAKWPEVGTASTNGCSWDLVGNDEGSTYLVPGVSAYQITCSIGGNTSYIICAGTCNGCWSGRPGYDWPRPGSCIVWDG